MPKIKDLKLSAGDVVRIRYEGASGYERDRVVRYVEDGDGARGGLVACVAPDARGRRARVEYEMGDTIVAVNGEPVAEWLALLARVEADKVARPAQYRPIATPARDWGFDEPIRINEAARARRS